ncbi:MAG: DUF1631 family protein [Hydrogenophaga sp.]|uniref:DUF1631 family protein n=1 Tax=Hydrogenophaga sp. TaxID=1904254 RepID=UPI002777F48B|nr:DUF1631 family protein [Hydrogenophaga sp.]MDP2417926.1 DUF1631 family protein [Hydrogenophaga sp.]MDZ4187091.1 DUF1631 family protein [Hydrogenophaga sp.]
MESSNSQAIDACLTEALSHMREWVPRWLSTLHETLHEREGLVVQLEEKQAIVQARLQLERHREWLADRFIDAFSASLKDAQRRSGVPARTLRSMRFDELELMADEQVQETVEFAQVQQVIKMAADETLVALNARMSRAQGLDRVQSEANPLRPEVVVAALMQALNGLPVNAAVRSRWLKTGAVALAQELNSMYLRLSDLLGNWGIVPAGYNVIPSPHTRFSGGGFSGAPVPMRPESLQHAPVLGSNALLTLDHLHQLLVGSQEPGSHDPVDPSAAVAPGMSNGMVRNLAAEVVTLMMRGIAEDKRLLSSLRNMLAGMEPALLHLARSDPRFFADRNNPARRLLDTVTERSLAFTSEQNPGYSAFASEIQGIVRALHAPGADLSSRFPSLLEALNRSQSNAIAPAQVEARGLAVQTLVRVEQRNLLAERVVAEIASRNDFSRVPGFVRRFLLGPWSQVVAHARINAAAQSPSPNLSPSDAPASRYMDILPDLLWSSQLALASRNRPRLIKAIPIVLRTLREGLESIDYPSEPSETFFQALMDLHMAAYKTPRNETPPDAPPSRQFEATPEPWMQPTEARDSGFLDDLVMDAKPAFAETQIMQRDWADIKAEMPAPHSQVLPVGTWVDVWQEGQALRCQITWASPHGTMFLFTVADGRSLSMTRRGLERLLDQDRLRVVAENGVLDAALDAVARQAWINSAKQ